VIAVEIPPLAATERDAFLELARREGDYAMVGIAARAAYNGRRFTSLSLALLAVADRPFLARRAADVLTAGDLDASRMTAAQAALSAELPEFADLNCTAETRKHLAGVLLKRVVNELKGQ
jgi:carbon-monoxide dehydrogenase medium subunit